MAGVVDESMAGGEDSDGSPEGELQERKLVCMVSHKLYCRGPKTLWAYELLFFFFNGKCSQPSDTNRCICVVYTLPFLRREKRQKTQFTQ